MDRYARMPTVGVGGGICRLAVTGRYSPTAGRRGSRVRLCYDVYMPYRWRMILGDAQVMASGGAPWPCPCTRCVRSRLQGDRGHDCRPPRMPATEPTRRGQAGLASQHARTAHPSPRVWRAATAHRASRGKRSSLAHMNHPGFDRDLSWGLDLGFRGCGSSWHSEGGMCSISPWSRRWLYLYPSIH